MMRFSIFLLSLWASYSYACSCGNIPIEKIALGKVNLTYVEIEKPNFIDRIKSLTKIDDRDLNYSNINVLKNYVGHYNYNGVYFYGGVSKYECGVKFTGGEKILISYQKLNEIPIVNSCNHLNGKKVYEIERLLSIYKEQLELQTKRSANWTLISKSKETENYASLSDYEKSHDLQTIWTLTNLRQHATDFIDKEPYKSFKAEITVSCKHKKFNVRSLYYFSEVNATGEIVDFANYAENKIFNWKAIEKGYPLHSLMKSLCM